MRRVNGGLAPNPPGGGTPRPPPPPARECAATPWTPRPKPGVLVERWLPKPMLGEKEGGVGGSSPDIAFPPRTFRPVRPCFFPFTDPLRHGSVAGSRASRSPTTTPLNSPCLQAPTHARAPGVPVIRQSLLMLVARAHKAKTAFYRRGMGGEKRLLYTEKGLLYPIFG